MSEFALVVIPLKAKPGHPAKSTAGRFRVLLDGEVVLPKSRQPLLDGARALLARGYPPDGVVTMRHEGSAHVALRSTIGRAAKLTVDETKGLTVFRKWEARPYSRVWPPMRVSASPVPDTGSDTKTAVDRPPRGRRCSK